MSTDLAPITRLQPPALLPAGDLLADFLSTLSPRTLRAYSQDISHFGRFLHSDPNDAVNRFLNLAGGEANRIAIAWKAAMTESKLSPATIARRLAALRSVCTFAATIGRIDWSLRVKTPKVTPYRDTRGPSHTDCARILESLALDTIAARRDRAIIRLARDLGLRRAEIASLDLGSIDLATDPSSLVIVGKGETQARRMTLPGPTAAAIADWLAVYPGVHVAGDPLFVRLDRAAEGIPLRLSGEGIARLIERAGKKAGVKKRVTPHQLRHAGITRALDRTNGDVRRVRQFSRHRRVETVLTYDDSRRDEQGQVAALVAEE